jgi:hypothetical protein
MFQKVRSGIRPGPAVQIPGVSPTHSFCHPQRQNASGTLAGTGPLGSAPHPRDFSGGLWRPLSDGVRPVWTQGGVRRGRA